MSWQSSPQEHINYLRRELKKVQAQIDKTEDELAVREEDLRSFEFEYEANVGYLVEQLAILEEEVNDYLNRIKIMRTEKTFGEGYRTVEDQFDEKWNAPRRERSKPKPPKTSLVTEAQLKKLYRQLARKYHPDLALDEDDRARRTEKMSAVNDAYKAKSLTELMALAEEAEAAQPPPVRPIPTNQEPMRSQSKTEHDMVQVLEEELERSRLRLFYAKNALQNFHHRPMVELALDVKFAQKEGRDILAEMAEEAKRKIARKEAERDMLKSQFDSLH